MVVWAKEPVERSRPPKLELPKVKLLRTPPPEAKKAAMVLVAVLKLRPPS
jgi:hypothetical protein